MKHNTHLLKIHNKEQLKNEMQIIGADDLGIEIMLSKGEFYVLKVHDVSLKAANIIKQEMLSKNGEVVLHKNVSKLSIDLSDILLLGTKKQFLSLIKKLKVQPFGLKAIATEIEDVLNHNEKGIADKVIDANGLSLELGKKTLVMGILNVTPDSFSDGGSFNDISVAIEHAKKMVAEGADIIDIGGESTRPGYTPVGIEEELNRVIPVVKQLIKEINVPISVDTSKAEVAREAVKAGAHIINDIWGLKRDPNMAKIIADLNIPVIIMHNRENEEYDSLISELILDLRESINIAKEAGIDESKIIIDPGIGFAKSYPENLTVMNKLDEIVTLGYPVLLGTSRKSIIGKTLDLPADDRMEGTTATVCYGIAKGCKIVRVHDVKEIKRACKMMDAMIHPELARG